METLFWSPNEGCQYIGLVRAHVCSNFIKMGLAGFRYWIAICSWSNVHFISPKSRFIFNVQYSISYKIYPGDCYIEMAYLLCWIRAQTIVKLQFEEQTEVWPHLNWSQKLIIVIFVLEFQVGLDIALVLFTTILVTTVGLVLDVGLRSKFLLLLAICPYWLTYDFDDHGVDVDDYDDDDDDDDDEEEELLEAARQFARAQPWMHTPCTRFQINATRWWGWWWGWC